MEKWDVPPASQNLTNHRTGQYSSSYSRTNRYEGYIVDLLDKVAKLIGFRYEIVPVRDGSYGFEQPDGTWDGMVGELKNRVITIFEYIIKLS